MSNQEDTAAYSRSDIRDATKKSSEIRWGAVVWSMLGCSLAAGALIGVASVSVPGHRLPSNTFSAPSVVPSVASIVLPPPAPKPSTQKPAYVPPVPVQSHYVPPARPTRPSPSPTFTPAPSIQVSIPTVTASAPPAPTSVPTGSSSPNP